MTDRTALAAALRVATPEMLRDAARIAATQAEDVERLWTLSPNDAPELQAARKAHAEAFRRLAALALAVAEWSERPARLAHFDNSWDDDSVTPLPWALRVPMTMGYTHHATLPAALAALLKGDQ